MRRTLALLVLPLALAGCPKDDPCTPENQKAAVWDLMSSWYLYPDLLRRIDPADGAYPGVQEYLDALTADARAQGIDRGWTYATTATTTSDYYEKGLSVGFGIGNLLRPAADAHWFISQVFPASAAADQGFQRGDEIVAIGDAPDALVDVPAQLTDLELSAFIGSHIGPSEAGVTRSFRVLPAAGGAAQIRTMTKRTYGIDPVPQGWAVIPRDGMPPAGYVALRTFITPADAQLENVFSAFRQAGVTDVVVDLRYNSGGRISTAWVLANLLGGNRTASDVQFRFAYNAYHPEQNQTILFSPTPQSVSPVRVAFITTHGSASASELVPNVMEAYLHEDVALVGDKTYGKPVGQQPFELRGCNLVVNVLALRIVNAEGDGGYYDGLPDAAGNFSGPLCPAADDLTHAMSDPAEASTAAALQWLATGTCPPPPAAAAKPSGLTALKATGLPAHDRYPEPPAPDEAQRNIKGLF